MEVQRLLSLVDTADGLQVSISWSGLTPTEDTQETLKNVYKDVPELLVKLSNSKNTKSLPVHKPKRDLGLLSGGTYQDILYLSDQPRIINQSHRGKWKYLPT